MDTIFALATPQGKSGVAVIRVSGPEAFEISKKLCLLPKEQTFGLRRLRDRTGQILDEALVLVFGAGRSFTGEPTVEFHIHGSLAIYRSVSDSLKYAGGRLAEKGEFTRRALESGRLDLSQVEALSDLIESETEVQQKQALDVFIGSIAKKVDNWRRDLVQAAALLEAVIDFADEEVPEDVTWEVHKLLENVRVEIGAEIEGFAAAERIRTGFEVAIVGLPNAGKSTLLNAISGKEVALTSALAGTTRDIIEVKMDLRGLAVTFLDTAGIRDSQDPLEKMGIDRAVDRANKADLRIFIDTGKDISGIAATDDDIIINGKGDLFPDKEFPVSGKTGLGVDVLLNKIADVLAERTVKAGIVSHQRQKDSLQRGYYDLEAAIGLLVGGPDIYDLTAEEIRSALRSLEMLLGHVGVEVLLGEIFSRFCLGK